MTQLGEGIAVTTISEIEMEDPHWAQVEYQYSNGKPVKGSFIATDGSGSLWSGQLNDQGQACLSNLPPGAVEFELVAGDVEDELIQTRAEIKRILDSIIAEQKSEAAKFERELEQQNALQQGMTHYLAYSEGLWNGAVGLVTFVVDTATTLAEIKDYINPLERVNNLLHASYKSYLDGDLSSNEWKSSVIKNLQDEEIKDIAKILGIDASHLSQEGLRKLITNINEAYEITAFIADDPESLDLLEQFGKDYAGAQSSVEWAEFIGGGVFEIVVAALCVVFTGGAGNVAQITSKMRHASKLKRLGVILRKLKKLLKRKKLRKKVKSNIDTKKSVKTDLPKDKKLTTQSIKKLKEKDVPCFKKNAKGKPAEYDRQLKGQQDGLNNMTANEYLSGRKAYTGKRASTEVTRKKYQSGLIEKYRNSGLSKAEATTKAVSKMKTLNALHNPDMIAAGQDVISDFGDAGVNKSIGAQWKSRVSELDKEAIEAIKNGKGNHKMNVKMHRCP